MSTPLIALTTDYGSGSAYVAELKGVLLSAIPAARLVDVSHDVPAQSIAHAEVLLRRVAFAFPVGTVHLVVVDPGVGTSRRPIAVRARGLTFVGPDNGVLGVALAEPGAVAVTLDRQGLFRQPVSPTFHGRDVFAPIAAELACGLGLDDVGTAISDARPSTLPAARVEDRVMLGVTLLADAFGNLTTNLSARRLRAEAPVRVQGRSLPRVRTYGEARPGELVCLSGSDGFLELAVPLGSAQALLGSAPVAVEGELA